MQLIHDITLQKMNQDEFKVYAQFSYENFLAETARSSGKCINELRGEMGGPPTTMKQNDIWLIVKNGERDIGFIWVEIKTNGDAFGWDIFLNEEYRSQGIGRHMMLTVAYTLAGYNVKKIQICVVEGNTIARKLYSSLGFHEIDFNETHNRYTLEVNLEQAVRKS